jgi:hypothetical protein
MKMEDVRAIAKSHDIKTNHLSKPELIRAIQIGEGNFDCFATACNGECDQIDCAWREDCLESAQHHKGESS